MSYLNRKWMVSFQDDGCLKAMNGWHYICDSDGGILLGYFKDGKTADDIVNLLNQSTLPIPWLNYADLGDKLTMCDSLPESKVSKAVIGEFDVLLETEAEANRNRQN